MISWKMQRKEKVNISATNRLRFEKLEDKRLLAIVWANEFGTGANNPDFDVEYLDNEAVARAIVNRAINDWNSVVLDQDFDNDNNPLTGNYQLTIFAADLGGGTRGATALPTLTNGIPSATTIVLDNDGGGLGWFFDQTPLDDAEFTAIADVFQASFVDSTTLGQQRVNDFYRTITHEIGHALGILIIDGLDLNSGNWLIQNQVTLQTYSLTVDTTDDLLGQLTYVGYDQVNPVRTQVLFDPNTQQFQPFTVVNELWEYALPGGATITFTENGGGHFYEGPADPNYSTAAIHPNDLMNPGRTVPVGTDPIETTRQFITDLNIQLLADAYGYTVVLPSTLNTAHAILDSETGVLLVQGRAGGLNDTITVDTVGSNVVVEVNATTETIPVNQVQRIVIAGNGGTDTIDHSGVTLPVEIVHYVVSSNEDSADAGTLGDGIVDLDPLVPGAQVSLRAAIRDANAAGGARGIYVPRGHYLLELTGTDDNASAGDLDITGEVTIVGAGAGSTIIDSGGSTGISDRVFDVRSSGDLDLSYVTVTGGYLVPSGGGIRVEGTLLLSYSAVVDNRTTSVGAGIFNNSSSADTTILNSVIAYNHTDNSAATNKNGGAVYANSGQLQIGNSIIANNTAAVLSTDGAADLWGGVTVISSLGDNLLEDVRAALISMTTIGNDHIAPVDYVVTGLNDTYDDTDNDVVMSIRDAIHQANITSGAEEIWLPAWNFVLTRDRDTYGGGSPTDMEVSFGDLDIKQSLVIRGAGGSGDTSVRWKPGVVDKVFELLGDYNGDGNVNIADWVVWRNTLGSTTILAADGNDDGIVDNDDNGVWGAHFGNTFSLLNVTVV